MKPDRIFCFLTAAILFLIGWALPVHAGSGKTSASFLLENLDAREVGLGGVFAASMDHQDESLLTNPAGIAWSHRPKTNLSYANLYDNGSQGFVGHLQPLCRRSDFQLVSALGVSYFTAGNIDINYANGTTESRTAEAGTAVSFALASRLGSWISLGLAPKYIRSTLVEQFSDAVYALDSGLVLVPFPSTFKSRISLGAAILNLGSKITYRTAEQDLPMTESGGASLRLFDDAEYGSFLALAQIERVLGEKVRYRLGAEYALMSENWERAFFLRGGYRIQFDDEDYSLGFGFRENHLQIDYAYVNTIELEKKHRLTLQFLFGKPDLSRRVREKPLLNVPEEIEHKETFDWIKEP
ncbi:MAG: PorV/PorQ family protein [Elusimicrobia bacterium]|nr:PorV/PorQ family protein [Elusimicrobiota bacterium]MBI4218416.1 PorV/PorQ family protein [Elusimicrobiota bacterium]